MPFSPYAKPSKPFIVVPILYMPHGIHMLSLYETPYNPYIILAGSLHSTALRGLEKLSAPIMKPELGSETVWVCDPSGELVMKAHGFWFWCRLTVHTSPEGSKQGNHDKPDIANGRVPRLLRPPKKRKPQSAMPPQLTGCSLVDVCAFLMKTAAVLEIALNTGRGFSRSSRQALLANSGNSNSI